MLMYFSLLYTKLIIINFFNVHLNNVDYHSWENIGLKVEHFDSVPLCSASRVSRKDWIWAEPRKAGVRGCRVHRICPPFFPLLRHLATGRFSPPCACSSLSGGGNAKHDLKILAFDILHSPLEDFFLFFFFF